MRYATGTLGWMDAVEVSPAHRVVDAARRASSEVLGRALPLAAYPGTTDASHFIGDAHVPSIAALGPGWLSVAHGPNECVGVSQLEDSVALYERLAHTYCDTTSA
ncbi:MAG: M20/M25/M40 family metallo-hydrolase [Streptosporangiaceae bacterium]